MKYSGFFQIHKNKPSETISWKKKKKEKKETISWDWTFIYQANIYLAHHMPSTDLRRKIFNFSKAQA